MNFKMGKIIPTLFFLLSANIYAASYTLPPSNESLVGQNQYIAAAQGDNVVTLAQKYDIGFNAIEGANPQLDLRRGFLAGTPVQVATKHLLPSEHREGIVINLPEMRMYYYPAGSGKVYTYPIGIGKIGKTIPITRTMITHKLTNPTWTPPEDIREFNLQQGIVLPKVMPAGPDNPLGPYAIYMRIPTYLIHSTIFPESVGKRASFGCIRMYETDIKDFFPTVQKGIPVVIVNNPTKLGWEDNQLFMEVHTPLEEHNGTLDASLPGMVSQINTLTKNQPVLVDWQAVSFIAQEKDGMPHEIAFRYTS